MSAMLFGAQAKPKAMHRLNGGKHSASAAVSSLSDLPIAEVTVSLDSFAVLPPSLAYEDIIEEAAQENEVDPDLIHAVIETESHFNPTAKSPVGAQGLMQLMPSLQRELKVEDPFDPRENIMAGAKYLKRLLETHDHKVDLALAAYNAGPANVRKYRGVPPFQETRNYVKRIRAILSESAD